VGQHGRPFLMYKFRTMRVQNSGPSITVGRDQRITRVGKWLRKTKFDELPQLWNVVKGEMSFVGPRPEVDTYVSRYSEEQLRVLDLKPGITDPASLAMYNESELLAQARNPEEFYTSQLMVEKIRMNLEYAAKANFLTDLLVILATVLRPLGIKLNVFAWLRLRPAQFKVPI
jgi:lipopolysaccharide/colanic/teichoic acid biosynthesis glycosyltransferase